MTRRAIALALAAAAALLGACTSRPTSPAECRPTAPAHQGSLLVLAAAPPESSIRGILPGAAPATAGVAYQVRWLVDARKAGAELRFQSQREGTGQVYREQFGSTSVSGLIAEFQSSLVFPADGCWDTDVFTGTAQGSLTFRVV
ncbi:MAG TPA: hypothetical protein VE953_21025 [Terriglobales bacterium]|nr:hypothetical protein [Terriglobales bacterium]